MAKTPRGNMFAVRSCYVDGMRLPLPEPSSMLPWIAIVLIAAIFWAFMGLTNSMLFFVIMALALGGSRIAKR